MANQAAVAATLQLQVSDLLTVGEPQTVNLNTGASIFNALTSSMLQFAEAGTITLPLPAAGNFGVLYVRNRAKSGQSSVALHITGVGPVTVIFNLSPGAWMCYSAPGNTGDQNGTSIAAIIQVQVIAAGSNLVPIEYLVAN